MKLSTCLLWAMAGSLAAAQKAGIRSHLALACWNTALKWDFECAAKENAVPCLCTNEPFLGTVLACIREKLKTSLQSTTHINTFKTIVNITAKSCFLLASLTIFIIIRDHTLFHQNRLLNSPRIRVVICKPRQH